MELFELITELHTSTDHLSTIYADDRIIHHFRSRNWKEEMRNIWLVIYPDGTHDYIPSTSSTIAL